MSQLCALVLCTAGLASHAVAQRASPTGHVLDEAGAPVAGAIVQVDNTTVVTDESGAFALPGGGTVNISADGYTSVIVAARAGMVVRLAAVGELIELSGRAPEDTKPLAYTMSAKDVATTPGAMNDALRAITVLPSTARIPFSFGGVVLRGMSPRDSRVFIDGVEIPLAFHFGGITGVFPTQALDTMRVVPSGFDVSMGRTQGGVVELTTRVPRGDAYRVGGEVSLLHSLASAEGPLPKRGAFLLTLRRSYFDVLARPLVPATVQLPSYADGQLRAVWGEPARRGQLATYLIGSLDRIANSEDAARPGDIPPESHTAASLGFVRAGAIYKRQRGPSLFSVAPSLGTNVLSLYSKSYPVGSNVPDISDLRRRWYVLGGRGEWLRDDPRGFVRAGVDVTGGHLGRVTQHDQADESDFPLPRNTVQWTDAAVFAEARRHWYGNRLSIRPGLRLDRFGRGDQWALDPRVNAHVTLSPTSTLRASLGRFHQPPSAAHFDELADNLAAKSSYVDQATLAVEVSPQDALTTSVTAFVHDGRQTLVDVLAHNIRPTGLDLDFVFRELLEEQLGMYAYQDNIGRLRSYGLETQVRYDEPRYRALASFAWSRANRRYDPALASGWRPYSLDQPLRLNLLLATTAYRWNVGTRLAVASGNPVELVPAGTRSLPGVEEMPPRVLLRLPTFWQLDVRVDRTWKHSWGHLTLFFDLQNVTNHRNVESRESNPNVYNIYRYKDVLGLPIIPYIGVAVAPR